MNWDSADKEKIAFVILQNIIDETKLLVHYSTRKPLI